MKALLEKILTDKTARKETPTQQAAVALTEAFYPWGQVENG